MFIILRFAATALLEYEFLFKTREIVSLSAQECLDCTSRKKYGCRGGWTKEALKFILKNGIDYERDYPYIMKQSEKCKIKKKQIAPKIMRKIGEVPRKEKSIYEQLRYGPMKVAMYASSEAFKNYQEGYLRPEDCKQQLVNHAVSKPLRYFFAK